MAGVLRLNCAVSAIDRAPNGVLVSSRNGQTEWFDHVVLATHADHALSLLSTPTATERKLLGAFRYSKNTAWLHTDERLMPKRRKAWSSWSVLGRDGDAGAPLCVTYWMNRLQALNTDQNIFVTLNPQPEVRANRVLHSQSFEHPLFDKPALAAQQRLWTLQGQQNTWFCGSYFGAGFHEDGLQSGLAAAEALGGVRRPWTAPNESSRICLSPHAAPPPVLAPAFVEAAAP
jgi:predicted NAD/FAD-binding protein